MKISTLLACILTIGTLSIGTFDANAAAGSRGHFAVRNTSGGVSAGSAAATHTPAGGHGRAGAVVTDGQGNGAAGHASAIRTPMGGRAQFTGGAKDANGNAVGVSAGGTKGPGAGRAHINGVAKDGQGNAVGASVGGTTTPWGGFGHAGGFTKDANGNIDGGSMAGFQTFSGRSGLRSGTTSVSENGDVMHNSDLQGGGLRGTASSSSNFYQDASGNTSGTRDTALTANSGASYYGNTSYEQGSGASHTSTCYNAYGEAVSCR